MQSLYLNHIGFKGFCKPRSGGANQKFSSPLSALRRGVWGEPHKKMKGKFLGLPRATIGSASEAQNHHAIRAYDSVSSHHARGACEDQSLRDWKKVRAKVSISPPNKTSRAESAEWPRATGAREGRKARRFATNCEGGGTEKCAALFLFRIHIIFSKL